MLSLALFSAIILASGVVTEATSCFSKESCDLRIDNNCYVHVDESVNWNEAEACCVAWGGHLASIHSDGANQLLNHIRNKDAFTWIGLSDTATNGVYVWTDGTPCDYNNFNPAQPDSYGGESCFHFFDEPRGELTWNDYHCNSNSWGPISTSYICQKTIRPQMDRSRCDVTLNGKCYISMNTRSTWQAAEDSCVEWGGHLASIHSDAENYAVNSIRDTQYFTWIGLSDTATNGVYVWTDGTEFDYNNFNPAQPDSLGGESCFHLFDELRGELTWNDYHCNRDDWGSVETSFVCKKDVNTCPTPCSTCSQMTSVIMGEKGDTGPVGPEGLIGQIGPFGPRGPSGPVGLQGITGSPGSRGARGNIGPQGEIGFPGSKGNKGDKGFRGIQGNMRD